MILFAPQLSTTCSRFAEAVALTRSLRHGINAYGDATPGRRDSPLLLQWARHMEFILVYQPSYRIPGLTQLLAAAVRAIRLHFDSHTTLAAAEAEHLLSICRAVTRLKLRGACLPCILPPTITLLEVAFSPTAGNERSWDPGQVDALIYAARLPSLKELVLDFQEVRVVQLTCPLHLGCLDKLQIRLSLGATTLNLSWVVQQQVQVPCMCLKMVIRLRPDISSRRPHAAMVQLLSQLQLSSLNLKLIVYGPLTVAHQRLWAQLKLGSLQIVIRCRDGFSQPDQALQVLPRCAILLLDFRPASWGRCPSICHVTWEALTAHAASIQVALSPSHTLRVSGASGSAPEHLQQPWQLVVCGGRGVQGLPPSQPTDEAYLLQNAAARAAGWTGSFQGSQYVSDTCLPTLIGLQMVLILCLKPSG